MSTIAAICEAAGHILKWFNNCCKEAEKEKEKENKKDSKPKNKKKKIDEESESQLEEEHGSELQLEEEHGSASASESVAMAKNEKKMRINRRAVKQAPETTQPIEAPESIEADVSPLLDNSMTFSDDKTDEDEDEDERSESEASHESEAEESKEVVPMTKNQNKSRKKRSNGYKAVDQAPITTQPTRSIKVSVCPQIRNKMIFNGFPGIPQLPAPSASPGMAVSRDIPTVQSIVEWVPTNIEKASELINRAVVGGYDIDESDLWIIKARLKCEEIPGKLNYYHSLGFVAHKKPNGEYAERNVEVFEVLCIDPELKERIRWTKCSNGVVPGNAIEGGRKNTGETLYIGRQFQYDENIPGRHSLCPGMIQPSHKVLYVTYDFKVYAHQFYDVLCID